MLMTTLAPRQKLLLPTSFLMAFLLGYYISAYQYSLLQIAAQFSFNSIQTGIIIGINYGAHAFLPIIFGYLADRGGKKIYLAAACLMLLLGQLLLFFAGGYTAMLLITFVAGSGFGAMQVLYLSMLADTFPGEATKYSNFAQTLFGLGAFSSPLIAAALEARGFSWQTVFLPCAVTLIAVIVLLLFTQVKESRPAAAASFNKKAERMAIFRSPLFYIIMLWMLVYIGVEVPISANAKAFFVQELKSPGYSALALSLFWIMMVPSRLLMGLVKKNQILISLILSILLALTVFAIPTVKSPLGVLVFFALSGFFCGPFWPTIFAASQKVFPRATSTAGSFCNAFGGLSGFLFSTLFGTVNKSHSLSFVYLAIGGISVVLVLLTLLFFNRMKKAGIQDT